MKEQNKNMINLNKFGFIFIIIALIIFFEPQSFKSENFEYLNSIDNVYKILKLVIGVPIIIMYLSKRKISKNILMMVIFQALALLSTILNSGDIIRFSGPAITTIVMIACGEMLFLSNKIEDTAKIITKYFRVIFFINVISVLLVDNTNYFSSRMIYFLGIENRWIFTYIPWMMFEFILYFFDKSKYKKSTLIFYILMLISLFFKWSVAAMFISLVYSLLFSEKIVNKLGGTIKYYIAILLSNIAIVKFKIQYIFEGIIRKLGKDPTLSGRTFLWDKILNGSPKELLLGNGMQSIAYDKEYFVTSSGAFNLTFLRVIHAHNSFMTILYRFGIIPLILYVYMLFYNLKKLNTKSYKYKNVLFITMIIVLLLSVFDTIDCAGLYLCMGIISNLEIDNKKKKKSIKESIKEKLKNNSVIYNIVESIYHTIYRLYCNLFGYIFRIFPIENNKVVIVNYYGKGYGDNAKYICDELLKHDYNIIWLVKKEYFGDIKFPTNVKKVKYNSIKGLYELTTAKFWIDNSRKVFYPPKRKKQFYIQTWHSSLRLKKIEKDAEDSLTEFYVENAKKDSKNINLITSGCGFSTNIYKNSFWYDGKILECGSPRCDIFFDKSKKENIKKKVYKELGIKNNKKIILYAPTFRKKTNINECYLNCNYVAEKLDKDYILAVRYHPTEKNKLDLNDNIINATDYPDMQELICAIDILVTDYSGCCFDAMINKTKCHLIAKDKEEYFKKERKLYFDYDSLPFLHAANEDELLSNIKEYNEKEYNKKIEKFCKEINLMEKGKASVSIVEYMMKVNKNEKI